MSGIAIIIEGANFENSPLGTVTLQKTASEIVQNYLTRVGAGDDNKARLVNLYSSLRELGVEKTIDIFPMLGSSLQNKLIGLKEQGDEYIFDSLQAGDNASSISNGILFADSNPNVNGLTPVTKTFADWHKLYLFAKVKILRDGTGYANRGLISTSSKIDIKQYPQSGKALFGLTREQGTTIVTDHSAYNNSALISSYVNASQIFTYFNGELWTTESVSSAVNPLVINNILAVQNDTSSHYFNAEVEMLALGFIEADKVTAVDAAFREYWQ